MSPLEAMIEALIAAGVELHFARTPSGLPSLLIVRDGQPAIMTSTTVLDLVHEACGLNNIDPEDLL